MGDQDLKYFSSLFYNMHILVLVKTQGGGKMTKLGQMLVDDGYKRGKIQGALLCGKTPEEVAEMFDILLQEVLKVKENEKDMKKA